MSGVDAGPFIGEELAGAADAGLDLVEDQEQAVLVAEAAQFAQEGVRHRADAALALDRLDHERRRLGADDGLQGLDILERHLVEAFDLRAEALEILGLAAGCDGRQRPAVEGALERDDAEALRMAVRGVVLAGHLDGRLVRLGAGIGEEDHVREGVLDQALGQPLAFRDLDRGSRCARAWRPAR